MKRILFLIPVIGLYLPSHAQIWEISTPEKLSGTVNSEAEESMPVFSKDSSLLYFTRTLDKKNTGGSNDQDIWVSKREKDGSYGQCQLLNDLNNKFHNAVFGVNEAGTRLYLLNSYTGKKDLLKGCAQSEGNGFKWNDPKPIVIPTLDIEGDAYVFHINESENSMIISYKGPETIGEEDLYCSRKINGAWTSPVHMGTTINSSGFETSPFLTKNGDTLFFSSNGFGGFGDADIFYSIRQDDSYTKWSMPVNLGQKINSPNFDAYFSISGINLYWSSNRDQENSDIYHAYILPPSNDPPLVAKIKTTDAGKYPGEDGKIDLTVEGGVGPFTFEWSNGAISEDLTNLSKGEYTVVITDSKGQKIQLSGIIKQPEFTAGNEIGSEIHLNPIYFDMAKWNIRPDAALELDKIVELMNKYPNMVIELGAHTDCRSSATYNMKLSEKRAQESVNYIQKRIINPTRIYGKGYGESKLKVDCPCEAPVFSNCSEEEHQKNRRTEFIIISMEGFQKTNSEFYIVKPKETLFRIHKNTGVSLEDLRRLNNLTSDVVKAGQKLKLR